MTEKLSERVARAEGEDGLVEKVAPAPPSARPWSRPMRNLWQPISELADIYQHPIWIASPKLVHADSNPLGIADGYWQDTEAPDKGEWRTTQFDMCNDEWFTITLSKGDVTHFLIPEGPWTAEELEQLEAGNE